MTFLAHNSPTEQSSSQSENSSGLSRFIAEAPFSLLITIMSFILK